MSFSTRVQLSRNFTGIAMAKKAEKGDETELTKMKKHSWEHKFKLLLQFKALYGHCDVPIDYEVEGMKLGRWASFQRKEYKKVRDNRGLYVSPIINSRRVARLESVGFDMSVDPVEETEKPAIHDKLKFGKQVWNRNAPSMELAFM